MRTASNGILFRSRPVLFAALLLNSNTSMPADPNVDVGISLPAAQQQPVTIDPTWSDGSRQGPCRMATNLDPVNTAVVPLNSKAEWTSWVAPKSPPINNQFSPPAGNSALAAQTVCCRPKKVTCKSGQWFEGRQTPVDPNTPIVFSPYATVGSQLGPITDTCQNTDVRLVYDPNTLEVLGSLTAVYSENATWLCTADNTVNPNDGAWVVTGNGCCSNNVYLIDPFLAGGQWKWVDGCGVQITTPSQVIPPPSNPCP